MVYDHTDLHYQDASSDKVYHAAVVSAGNDTCHVIFAYGRRDSALSRGAKTTAPVPKEKAEAIYKKLLGEKVSKGYQPRPGISGNVFGHDSSSPTSTNTITAAVIHLASKVHTGLLPQLLNPITESEAERLINDPAWGAQEKKNGKRQICDHASGKVKGVNRKGIEIAPAYEISTALSICPEGTYDGEAVGNVLHAFDLLSHNGVCIRHLSYSDRYDRLASAIKQSSSLKIVPLARTRAEKQALWDRVKAEKGEGVVFKRLDSPFVAGRPNSGGDQLKFKFWRQATVEVAGVNPNRRSIQMSMLDKGKIVGVGNCTIPANYPLPRPGALAEIRYLYAYKGGSLYQPQYEGERDDIETADSIDTLTYYIEEEYAEAA